VRAAVVESALAQARARAPLVRLTSTGSSALTRAVTISERVTVTIPLGPLACSVTCRGASALAVITIAERSSDCASAVVVTHARVEPIPIVGGRLLPG